MHTNLKVLRLAHDPFKGGLNLAQLPCLQVIHLSDGLPVPLWLHHQKFDILLLKNSFQLDDTNTQKLMCRHLSVCQADGSSSWKLTQLLHMPHLRELHISVPIAATRINPSIAVRLEGSCKQHRDLMLKIEARFLVLVVLAMPRAANGGWVQVSLKGNGHPFACMCSTCCHSA